MEYALKFFAIIITAASFTVLFRSPRKYFFLTVLIGVISATLYHSLLTFKGVLLSVAISGFVIGTISQILARITNSPSQGFLIPGVVMLAPGVQIFAALEKSIGGDFIEIQGDIYVALAIACSVSFSILLSNWFIPSRKEL